MSSNEQDAGVLERYAWVNTFWDTYQDSGMALAARYLRNEVEENLPVLRLLLPFILTEGHKRDVDMGVFIKELQEVADAEEELANANQEEASDANTTTDDVGRLPDHSDNEAVDPEHEAEAPGSTSDDPGTDEA